MKAEYIDELTKLGKNIIPDSDWLIEEGDQNFQQNTINDILDMVENKRFLHTDFCFENMIDTHDRYLKFEEMSRADKKEIKKAEKKHSMSYKEMMKRAILYQLSYSNFLCAKQSDRFTDNPLEEKLKCVENYKGDKNKSFLVLSPFLTHLSYKTLIFDFSDNDIEILKDEHGCYLVSSFYHNRDKNCSKPNKAYICISSLDDNKMAIKDIDLGVFLEIDWYDYNPISIDYDIGKRAGISKEAIYVIFRYLMIQSYKASDMNLKNIISSNDEDSSGHRRNRRKHTNHPPAEFKNPDIIKTNKPLKQKVNPSQNYDYNPTIDDDDSDDNERQYKDNTVRAHCQRYHIGHGDNKQCVTKFKSEYSRGTKKRENRSTVYRTESDINPEDIINLDEEDTDNEQKI